MSIEDETFDLALSPNVRLRMTVAEEMTLDAKKEIFNDDLYAKYVAMHREADRQQQGALKGVVYADIGLSLIMFGKNLEVPGTGLGLQDIPAATEVLTVAASFFFLIICQAFANTQCYQAIIEQFSNNKALKLGIDPDYVTYGDVFSQVYLKAFRPQMSVFLRDFFVPRTRYKRFYGFVTLLLALSWASILFMHIAVVSVGVWNSIGSAWFWWPFAGAILLLHLTGLIMNMFLDFAFDVPLRERVHEARGRKADQQTL